MGEVYPKVGPLTALVGTRREDFAAVLVLVTHPAINSGSRTGASLELSIARPSRETTRPPEGGRIENVQSPGITPGVNHDTRTIRARSTPV